MGTTEKMLGAIQLGTIPNYMAWCGQEAVLAVFSEVCQARIITSQGDTDDLFIADVCEIVQELDGARILSGEGQEIIQEVPQCLLDAFSIASTAPGALLRFASEEFSCKSHKADEYLREIADKADVAVATCVECAGHVLDPKLQKELLRAAQFGKHFLCSSGTVSSALPSPADDFTRMCLTLRVLNTLRSPLVGIPLTIRQYNFLTPHVVLDRLLTRHLYPLALKVCRLLKISDKEGENRVLAHWACYKVGQDDGSTKGEDDAVVARTISRRLGHHPRLSYRDIAAKAADCGRKGLAIRYEVFLQIKRSVFSSN